MASFRLAALVPTSPASTASPAKCSRSSTCAVPLNSLAIATWWVRADAADAAGARTGAATPSVAIASVAIPTVASVFFNLIMMLLRWAMTVRVLLVISECSTPRQRPRRAAT